ncbi:hypothetical protein SPHINGO8BC_10028 [Sphingobacterium multivorum]|uniref:Uncharacterized protein n=1 Tax=Sphingobacterium multivorum TaxID=28454 RepID=A0A653XJ71_SPHMU|nr:hypothetical protein SPHINGO8BC_10028 [Sphingobacterium multivorum]
MPKRLAVLFRGSNNIFEELLFNHARLGYASLGKNGWVLHAIVLW